MHVMENLPGETRRRRSPGRRSDVDQPVEGNKAPRAVVVTPKGRSAAANHVAQARAQASGHPLRPSMGGYGSTVAPEEAVSPP